MLVKTSDLIGPALDWAVAQIDGVKTLMMAPRKGEPKKPFALFGSLALSVGGDDESSYAPSTCWHCGGPLIEEHAWALPYRATHRHHLGAFEACTPGGFPHNGPTPLIAACRAIVAALMGDQIDVPDELMQS